jgi:DNA-binding transcriptional MerR regulator
MQPQKMSMSQRQFRIGDLAKELKVKKFVIRFWEKEFGIKSDRSQGGQRFYTEQDLQTFLLIKDLLYQQGFTIAGAKKQLPLMLKEGLKVTTEISATGVQALVEPMLLEASDDAEDFGSDGTESVVSASVETAPVIEPVAQVEPERMLAAVAAVEVADEPCAVLAEQAKTDETVIGATNAALVEAAVEEVELEGEEDLEAAPLLEAELDEAMVKPATKELCPCAHVHDQLSGLKVQLLELKVLLER